MPVIEMIDTVTREIVARVAEPCSWLASVAYDEYVVWDVDTNYLPTNLPED